MFKNKVRERTYWKEILEEICLLSIRKRGEILSFPNKSLSTNERLTLVVTKSHECEQHIPRVKENCSNGNVGELKGSRTTFDSCHLTKLGKCKK